ncbi:hypothetical protein MA16_Dca003251 [Dendrobium catenatum]|uniref:Uncharacterized protein n=1 Tax=Dendrobium catenatum TaxID=906689 RepID=A0A2I0XC69_9ASPA|nr:hypothetical protein MA16_Dca003251 [Dendrobium catenatum]
MVNLFQEFEARMSKNFEKIVRRVNLIDEKLQHCIVQGIIKPDQQAAPSSSSFIPHTIPSPKNIRVSSEHTKTDAPKIINDAEMTQAAQRVYKKKKLKRKSRQKKRSRKGYTTSLKKPPKK